MKITYPECQIEISTDEIIDLMDHFVERTKSRKHENPKEPDNHEEDPAPTFEPGGFVPDDGQPAPNPYPNLTDHEAIIPRDTGFQDLIMQGLKEAEAQGKLPEVIPTDESTSSSKDDSMKEEGTPAESTRPRKAHRRMNPDNESKKVDVLFDDYGWKTFNSVSEAAKAIDARVNHLNHALLNDKTCNGHHVRYHAPDPAPGMELPPAKRPAYSARKVDVQAADGSWTTFDTVTAAASHLGVKAAAMSLACRNEKKVKGYAVRYHSDMDNIMNEIKESDKKPYQTTPPVR